MGIRKHICCLLYTSDSSAAIQTLRIEMALKLNNSDEGGGIHNEFFHEGLKKKDLEILISQQHIVPTLEFVCLHVDTLIC